MTAAEQVSVDALAARMEARFDKLDVLMEARRLEEVRVQENLILRIEKVDSRVNDYDRAKTVAEAFFSFGKWLLGASVALTGLVITFLTYH